MTVGLVAVACSGSASPVPDVAFAPSTIPEKATTTVTVGDAPLPHPVVTTSTIETPDTFELPEEAVVVKPGDDLANLVAGADEGSVFVLERGVHRMQAVVPKDGMAFFGIEGAVMSGARILDGFVADGDLWRSDGITMSGGVHGQCIDGYDGCGFDQDLFMDDVMLWQVTEVADLESGRWAWDGTSIYVADDPTIRRVELSVTPYAFVGAADDVSISGLKIEKYATPAQEGAVQAQEPSDGVRGARWLIEDVEVTGAHGVGVRTGDFTIVRNSYLHHNGQMGITVSGGTDVLIEENEIAFNNVAGFAWGWEAGGGKFTESVGLVVRANHSHDNGGPGLWTDIDARDTVYEDNLVTDNEGPGIFHEISYAAVIRGNIVTGNGFGKPEWLWGAGILIAASSDVEIIDNDVVGNADGIAGIQQERGAGPFGRYLLQNVKVTGNTISMEEGETGVVEDTGADGVFTDRDISFGGNTYKDVTGRRFAWDGRVLDRRGWLAIGQGAGSVWL